MIDIGLIVGYTLLIVAILAAVVLPLISAMQSPAAMLKSLYGVIALIVLFVIAYAVSSSEVTPQWRALGITEGVSKLVGGGLILFYITMVLAIIGLIYSEINKALK